ncbi:hypothetical protein LTR84_010111 [Exophiala bonariae]|uniref:Uncharacterized protein n=1 Tax=Exophiala bonariae TaxID=1690606 RepID=A0AAV9NP11_9EURO|nr:hypothetical protein LTR84_010111 [Exophiala bonariae]
MDPATPNAPFKWEAASGLADELHENRHRRIAELVAEYKAVGEEEGRQAQPTPRPGLDELPLNVHRPRVQPARPQHDPDEQDDAEDNDENDDIEATTTDTTASDHMAPPGKPTKAEKRALKRAAKAVKSQNKAFKNQARHTISVKTQDVEFVNTVLHGEAAPSGATHPLASDKTIEEVIQRNLGFVSHIEAHKRQLIHSIGIRRRDERRNGTPNPKDNKKRRFSAVSNNSHQDEDEEDEETENLLTAVLVRLGIDQEQIRLSGCAGKRNTNLRKSLGKHSSLTGTSSTAHGNNYSSPAAHRLSIVGSLKRLVREDLEKFDNDQHETYIRAGGFWRYVGKPVFDRMTAIAGELDWKTGVKLKEVNAGIE